MGHSLNQGRSGKRRISDKEKLILRVSVNTLLGNGILSAYKLAAGLLSHSGAMVSDAVHSASDVFSTIVVMIGCHMSEKESDEEHPYGHERLECVAALLLAAVLCATGLGIGLKGIQKLCGGGGSIPVPGVGAAAAAVVSILAKEGMYWYARLAAVKINSSALMADAWHHRSDALSSVGSLMGILGARLGFPLCDPAAGVAISVFIVKASYDICRDAVSKMIDRSCNVDTIEHIIEIINRTEGVKGIDKLQTRLFGSKIYIDVEIRAEGSQTLADAHLIAHRVHDAIEEELEEVKHCMVHVNPL